MARQIIRIVIIVLVVSVSRVVHADMCPAPANSETYRWREKAEWDVLAAQGYRIGSIHIVVDNVFDLNNPAQNSWYARLANKLHITTHPRAIREQLLFKSGDPVNPRIIYESARRLHAIRYLRESTITPENCSDHSVDVSVQVKDAWTLKLDLQFAHVGGQNTLQFEVTDANIFGTGKSLSVGHTSDLQRTSNLINYQDPALFGSYWQLATTYEDLSDGHIKYLSIGQPFYEDQTPWSVQTSFYDQEENINFYNQGALAWSAPSTLQQHYVSWAHLIDWSGEASGMRAGVLYNDSDYGYGSLQLDNPGLLPEPTLTPRQLAGVGITWEYFQDRYASFTNMQYIARTEDYNLGWNLDLQAGRYGDTFGGNVSAPFYGVSVSWGSVLPGNTVLLASGFAYDRQQNGVSHNLQSNITLTSYNQYFPRQTLVAHVQWDSVLRPDPESYLYIGGLQGLRGYPNYYAIGDRRWQATFEDRIVTPVQILSLFQLGFVGYVDIAQIHQLSPTTWSPTYSDVGLGFRIGSIRSAFDNTFYFTVAWPLKRAPGVSGHEIVIGNVISF
ncbi:MAG TPA: hypothetical protein VNF48_03105 [Gammaproteobacteria bacterium]|nr:hypothetical protein [Gammaproteobacteria bacterium]